MAGEEGAKPSSDKAKKFDTSFKKAVGGSLKLKGVEFKGYRSLQAAACASVCGSRPLLLLAQQQPAAVFGA